jgi:hypothetical protein
MAIEKVIVCCMCRLQKMMVLVLMLQMKQLSLGTNIGNVQINVLRNNWIRTKTCLNSKAKCFMFRRVTIE